jgi:prepilin-type N-terminal cleavage/methylation domain-containing protein/prepilin-type processing-associated H-X9-DG protein
MAGKRAGFTLVELLVVIGIIAVLAALLLPAVNGARERARITQCAHNQGELGKAILSYELDKKHFPGYANTLRGRVVSWAPLLLPYINRNDLWEDGWRDGGTPGGKVPQFLCPADRSDLGSPLSFVVNVGRGQDTPAAMCPPLPPSDDSTVNTSWNTQWGLFRNFTLTGQNGRVRQVTLTDLATAATRPMLAESVYNIADANTGIAVVTNRQWTDTEAPGNGTVVTSIRFGFLFWPVTNLPATGTPNPVVKMISANMQAPGAILPIHHGQVNVTFCDGHTEALTSDPNTVCGNYQYDDIK